MWLLVMTAITSNDNTFLWRQVFTVLTVEDSEEPDRRKASPVPQQQILKELQWKVIFIAEKSRVAINVVNKQMKWECSIWKYRILGFGKNIHLTAPYDFLFLCKFFFSGSRAVTDICQKLKEFPMAMIIMKSFLLKEIYFWHLSVWFLCFRAILGSRAVADICRKLKEFPITSKLCCIQAFRLQFPSHAVFYIIESFRAIHFFW